jgi:hypothetical protein
MAKIVLPGQNVAIQTPHNQIEPLWYEKLKGWESWINLVSSIFPSGPATPTTPATALHASLGADQALNTSTYADGPSIAQGMAGTWWVSGHVTVTDTATGNSIVAKLWDGTNIVDSAYVTVTGANFGQQIALSGYIVSPAGNLKISCKSVTTATSKMLFNISSNSRDSTISAFRIA